MHMDTAYEISKAASPASARPERLAQCGRLFAGMTRIGLIGFGGGNALVPVIERETVGSGGLITKEEFDRAVVVANITSGALPIEVASGVGRKIAGAPGMIAAAVGMGLPGALLALAFISLFSVSSAAAMDQMRMASVGVSMLIAYLLVSYAARELLGPQAAARSRAVSAALLAASFLLTCGGKIAKIAAELGLGSFALPQVSTLDVLGVFFFGALFTQGHCQNRKSRMRMAAALAIASAYLASRAFSQGMASHLLQAAMVALAVWGLASSARDAGAFERPRSSSLEHLPQEALAWLAFIAACTIPALIVCPHALEFAARSALSVLMSFGGGDAYLAFGQGMFVDSGMVSNAAYYGQVVTLSNALPGSIICKVLVGVGYLIGESEGSAAALLMALAGFGIGVGISGLTFLVAYHAYGRLEDIPAFDAIRRYIRPVIAGILLTIAVTMVSLNVEAAHQLALSVPAVLAVSAFILALLGWAARTHKAPLGKLILAAIGVALGALNVLALIA